MGGSRKARPPASGCRESELNHMPGPLARQSRSATAYGGAVASRGSNYRPSSTPNADTGADVGWYNAPAPRPANATPLGTGGNVVGRTHPINRNALDLGSTGQTLEG